MIAGLITKDAAGNVLLDTTTAMFRLLGVMTIRWAWRFRDPGYFPQDFADVTGTHKDQGLTLGTPFFFFRPLSFYLRDPFSTGYLSMSATGDTISWTWLAGAPTSSGPIYYDIYYGVQS
jgi:hypothetical protein